MSTLTETKLWDLSHCLEFANSLSTPQQQYSAPLDIARAANSASHQVNGISTADFAAEDDDANGGVGLGSFGKVWEFLGTPGPTKHDVLLPAKSGQLEKPFLATKLDYTSDGAAYTLSRGEPVRFQRHPSFTDGTDGEDQRPDVQNGLTKTQKKRLQRRRKREREAAQANGGRADAISESEAEIAGRRTPASKASAHIMKEKEAETPTKPAFDRTELLKRIAAGKARKEDNEARHLTKETSGHPVPAAVEQTKPTSSATFSDQQAAYDRETMRLMAKKVTQLPAHDSAGSDAEETTSQAVSAVAAAMAAIKLGGTPPTPSPIALGQRTKNAPSTPKQSKREPVAQTQPVQKTQFQTPQPVSKIHLVPASVGVQPIASRTRSKTSGINPTAVAQSMHVPSGPQSMQLSNISASAKKPRAQPVIEPRIIRSGEDRHWAMLMKLINVFGDDRKHLVSPANLTTHNNDPRGIHVFVDASNIFIGFIDMLKQTRGIHPMARVPDVHLSFDSLALLMERRRPVAKRVLAGSNPWIPEFDKAKAVGYEMNIFEKVYKARELTDRMLFFQEQDARRYGKKGSKGPPAIQSSNQISKQGSPPQLYSALNGVGSGSGMTGTETSNQPQYAPAKMIEQGVDEILHLKMLESVVDYEIPTTIVLATGDAADAEYSSGFMAMVERALKKGWTVELLSWSKNINRRYIKSQWTEAWDGRFKIIYLDDFAEELLDM